MEKEELIQLVSRYPVDDANKKMTELFLREFEDCWSTKNTYGHITASCWVLNFEKTRALMTHHSGLNEWFQLGGHVEQEDRSIFEASERELREESGLRNFTRLGDDIFDIDVHKIPRSKKKNQEEHFHFDIRFVYFADEAEDLNFDTNESNAVEWLTFSEIGRLTQDDSVLRMMRKTSRL